MRPDYPHKPFNDKRTFFVPLVLFFFVCPPCWSQEKYTVRTKDIQGAISPTLWGLFFEDINRGADGGVYAEMVENRSFDFPKPLTAWTTWPKPNLRDGIFM